MMKEAKPGERIGAVFGLDDSHTELRFLGYGVYEGDEVPPPKTIGAFGFDYHEVGNPNPKLVLDNGDVVWGCQCWWGPEESVRKILAESTVKVVTVRMADMLAEAGVGE